MDISLPEAYEAFLNELDKYPVEDMDELLTFAFWSGWKAAGGDVPEGDFWDFSL